MTLFGREIAMRVIIIGVIALMLVVAIGFGVHSCDVRRSKGAQSRINQGQSGAFQNSANDAANTLGNASARESESDELTRSNEKDIRNAEGSNAAVNPAARDAGLRALCLRRAYRDDPKCKLLKPPAR